MPHANSILLQALPSFLAVGLSCWLFLHVRRQPQGARIRLPLLILTGVILIWCGTSLLTGVAREAPYLEALYIGKFAAVGFMGPLLTLFAVRLLDHHGLPFRPWPAWRDGWLLAIGAADAVAVATNPWHHQYFTLTATHTPQFGPGFWIHTVVGYGFLAGIIWLFRAALRRSRSLLLRQRIYYMSVGAAIPIAVNAVWLAGWIPITLDPSPLAFVGGWIFFVFGATRVQPFSAEHVALRAALAGAHVGYLVSDLSGELLYANDAARRMVAPARLTYGMDVRNFCHEAFRADDAETVRELVTRGLRNSASTVSAVTVRVKGGGPTWLQVTLPVLGGESGAGSLLITLRDVTEEQTLTEQVRVSEQRYRAVVEQGPVGLFLHRKDGTIVYANPRLHGLLGYPAGALVGRNWQEFLSESERWSLDERRRNGWPPGEGPDHFTINAQHMDGTTRRLEVFQSVIAVGEEPLDQITILDVTEIEAYREEQRELQKRLTQAEKLSALGELVSGVAHELNNPLTAVMGYAELLHDGSTDPDVRTMLHKIVGSVDRCKRIVGNLLDFARQRPPEVEAVDLNAVVRSAVELRQYDFRVKTCEVILELPDMLPRCLVDRTQLEQVVLNLLNNAFDAVYDRETGRRIVVTTRMADAGVQLTVRDSGPGVPASARRRIFDPFYSTKGTQGTGLGLSVTFGIVQAHGGTITLDTVAPEPASFTVTLPPAVGRHAADALSAATDDTLPPFAIAREKQACVLVVDDEEYICDLSRQFLESEGYTVATAQSGAEARQAIQETEYDVIVSDIRMPGDLDGPALYQWIARARPQLLPRMLFATGDTAAHETREFLASVPAPCLIKPFRRAGYLQAVAQVLDSSAPGHGETGTRAEPASR